MIRIIAVIALLSCGIDYPQQPDAGPKFGIHGQTVYCDRAWDLGPYPLCEHACAIKPATKPCSDSDVVCADRPACTEATAPNASGTRSCAATFDVDGVRGCCDLLEIGIGRSVPTFFECQ